MNRFIHISVLVIAFLSLVSTTGILLENNYDSNERIYSWINDYCGNAEENFEPQEETSDSHGNLYSDFNLIYLGVCENNLFHEARNLPLIGREISLPPPRQILV